MIRKATVSDAAIAARLAANMWGSHDIHELTEEFAALLACDDAVVFLYSAEDTAVGFAQCQLRRDYVEGTSSSPVGYLEGVYMDRAFRGRGYAKQLVAACEQWAKEKGCREFASDCELSNTDSLKFHLQTGFTEANRIICFTKKLA